MSYIKYLYRLFYFLGNTTRASTSIAFCGHYAISIYIDCNLRLWWPILNFWLVALCDLDTGLHRCGKWSERWVNSSWVMVAMICSPCCPAQIFPFPLSYLSIQCNLNQGAVPLFLHSLCSRSPLLISQMSLWRENDPVELDWLTESWHPIVGTLSQPATHSFPLSDLCGTKGKTGKGIQLCSRSMKNFLCFYNGNWKVLILLPDSKVI